MQRRAIQISSNTLMVTLPSKWVQESGIKKGDIIDINETNAGLLIKPLNTDSIANIEIKITSKDKKTIKWLLSALYKWGYDEIRIHYELQETRDKILELMKMFAGLAISQQDSNSLTLKVITKERSEEFDTCLRKNFLVTLSLADGCLENLQKRRFNELNNLLALENTNNQFSNFCERILVKNGYEIQEQTCFIFFTIMNLERIGDFYRYIIDFSCENPKQVTMSPLLKKSFEKVNNLLKEFYNVFYNFNIENLSLFYKEQTEIGNEYIEKIFKNGNFYEIIIAHYLMDIVTLIVDSVPGSITIKKNEKINTN